MNPTKIEWADFTWNPIVGCRNGCPYCYARRIATTRLKHLCEKCGTFDPHFHSERLREPFHVRRPALIFADSMADWWSEGVDEQMRSGPILTMLDANAATIRSDREKPYFDHRFVVLTKRPERITELDAAIWPDNAWLGVSITSGADWWRWEALLKLPAHIHKFVSVEPVLDSYFINHFRRSQGVEWLIVGPLSNGAKKINILGSLCQESVRMLCGDKSIPLFEKAGLPLQPAVHQMPPDLAGVFRKGLP